MDKLGQSPALYCYYCQKAQPSMLLWHAQQHKWHKIIAHQNDIANSFAFCAVCYQNSPRLIPCVICGLRIPIVFMSNNPEINRSGHIFINNEKFHLAGPVNKGRVCNRCITRITTDGSLINESHILEYRGGYYNRSIWTELDRPEYNVRHHKYCATTREEIMLLNISSCDLCEKFFDINDFPTDAVLLGWYKFKIKNSQPVIFGLGEMYRINELPKIKHGTYAEKCCYPCAQSIFQNTDKYETWSYRPISCDLCHDTFPPGCNKENGPHCACDIFATGIRGYYGSYDHDGSEYNFVRGKPRMLQDKRVLCDYCVNKLLEQKIIVYSRDYM